MRLPWFGRLRWTDALNLGAALALAGLGVAEIYVPLESRNYDGDPFLTVLSVAVLAGAVIIRRPAPVAVFAGAVAVATALHAFGRLYVLFYGQMIPALIMLFGAVRWGRRYAPVVTAAIGLAMQILLTAAEPQMQNLNEGAFEFGIVVLVWLAAFLLRVQAHRVQRSIQRAIDVEVAAAENAIAAVTAERTRIARELHDIVGHAVSVMVVQAGAAEQVVEDDPEYARRALQAIRNTGTGAMTEMRRLVSMLRDDSVSAERQPQPGVDRLPELLDGARSGGLEVVCAMTGEVRELAAGIDLAAYRIVQEALTNVRRHAQASRVDVALDYGPDLLAIRVADDGIGPPDIESHGHGLVGMRERVALYGGRVETAGGPGFTVHAVIPLAST